MSTILLTVKFSAQQTGVDLEVPAKIPLTEMIPNIVESLNSSLEDYSTPHIDRKDNQQFVVQVKQGIYPFVLIAADSTLEQAGIFDGAILLIEQGPKPSYSDIKCQSPKENYPCLQDVVSCKLFVCKQGRNWVGREKQSDNPIDIDLNSLKPTSSRVSRKHALIYQDEAGQWFILDKDSSNGTLINGRHLSKGKPECLHNGNQIRFGQLGPVLIFYLPAHQL